MHREVRMMQRRTLSPRTLTTCRKRGARLVGLRLGLVSKTRFAMQTLSFGQVRFNGGPAKAPRTALTFSAAIRPVFRGGFSLMDASFASCRGQNCALCVYASDRGRTGHLGSVFRRHNSRVAFVPIGGALRRNFASGMLGDYFFASRRVFSHFRGCGLHDSGTHDNGITLALGRLDRFRPNSFIMRVSRNMNHFNKLMHVPGKGAARRIVGLVCRGRSIMFISVRSLRGVSGCGKGRKRAPHLGGLKANT